MLKLNDIAKKCNEWILHKGPDADLLMYLNEGRGFVSIKTYDEFCELARILNADYQYHCSTPPCDYPGFAYAILVAHPEAFLTQGDEDRGACVAEKFHRWMEAFAGLHSKTDYSKDHNKALKEFLGNNLDCDYLRTQEQYETLVNTLCSKYQYQCESSLSIQMMNIRSSFKGNEVKSTFTLQWTDWCLKYKQQKESNGEVTAPPLDRPSMGL